MWYLYVIDRGCVAVHMYMEAAQDVSYLPLLFSTCSEQSLTESELGISVRLAGR